MPSYVDTVVVGSGPSALILSFLLSGHEPVLSAARPHPDPQLQAKLRRVQSLLDVDVQDLAAHFPASRFSYSTQALPVNTLFDTLLRPLVDTEPGIHESCVEWRASGRRVPHLVLGSSARPGGQWQENPVRASWDIGALSYAELLSLPGYSLEAHLRENGQEVCEFLRPSRRQIADYLRAYPDAVGIGANIRNSSPVSGVQRTDGGFYISSHDLHCRNLVLASGTFSRLIPARQELQQLLTLPPLEDQASSHDPAATTTTDPSLPPLLIVGSGFSAADLIITNLPKRKVIHIFKWDPVDCVSPLRACHPQAYPEYAAVYRRMKAAAMRSKVGSASTTAAPPIPRRKSDAFFDPVLAETNYEGFPNTWIKEARVEQEQQEEGRRGFVVLKCSDGTLVEREVAGLQYVIGRRGTLSYLDEALQNEVFDGVSGHRPDMISGRTLRPKVEDSMEVAPRVFAIGSLVGDSLIRHAYGSCITAAGEILKRQGSLQDGTSGVKAKDSSSTYEPIERTSSPSASKRAQSPSPTAAAAHEASQEYQRTNGHESLWRHARRRLSNHVEELEQTKKKRSSLISECVLA